MAWYRTGTASFTNGSTSVTGSGTAWVANGAAGQGILAPDGRVYEVAAITADGTLTLGSAFLGSTVSGAAYALMPTQDYIRTLATQVATLINDYAAVKNNAGAGRFADGSVSQPGVSFTGETSSGLRRAGTSDIRLTVGGIDRLQLGSSGTMTTGTATVSAGSVGGAVNDVTNANVALYAAGNSVYLEQKAIRHTAGSDWNGLALELRHRVDLTGQGFLSFNTAGAPSGVTLGGAGGASAHFTNVSGANRQFVFAASNGGNPTVGTTAGSLAISAPLIISGGSLTLPTTSAGIELGQLGASNTPYFDFHSGTTATDYDVRFQASGGTTSVGMGVMTYTAGGGHVFLGSVTPAADNTYTNGTSGLRWSVIYSAGGVVTTSDARAKTEVAVMTADEIAAACQLARELGTFQFLDAIEKKGTAHARRHVGTTVQRVIEILEQHSLQPMRYAFVCYDEWPDRVEVVQPAKYECRPALTADLPEIRDEAGVVLQPARTVVLEEARTEVLREEVTQVVPGGNRYSLRTDQLALFIARGQAARQDSLEARIAALEAA